MNTRTIAQAVAPLKPSLTATPAVGLLQRKCARCEALGISEERQECSNKQLSLQRRAASQDQPFTVPPIVHEVLRSPGQPLDAATRAFMEPRFGHDFSRVRLNAGEVGQGQALTVNRAGDQFEQEADQIATAVIQRPTADALGAPAGAQEGFNFAQVRIHADARAAEAAQSVRALAYTVGRDIVFGAGQYSPETPAGRRLLAHELTHVVQQGRAQPTPLIQRMDWGPLGGKCCNESPEGSEWALVGEGTWQALAPGECTGFLTDCDGMTCGGGFYYVSGILAGGICRTPRNDDATFRDRRWTPSAAMSRAISPRKRGSNQGDTPPGYQYDER